jgi:hypothetical protein
MMDSVSLFGSLPYEMLIVMHSYVLFMANKLSIYLSNSNEIFIHFNALIKGN